MLHKGLHFLTGSFYKGGESMSKQKKDIKTIFYEQYKMFGQYTTNKSLQKELEIIRNNIAVDFYNLKYDKKAISEFADKYAIDNQRLKTDHSDYSMGEMFIKGFIDTGGDVLIMDAFTGKSNHNEQKKFRKIVDKIIENEKLEQSELNHISRQYLGKVEQYPIGKKVNDVEVHHWQLGVDSQLILLKNYCIIKAIYEWVILLSRENIKVCRCKAPECKKLFNPTPRGRNQRYCSNACKVRAYRQQHQNK